MFDIEVDELEALWMAEARADAKKNNPLVGYCQRVYFQRTSCKRRSGPKKGKRRRYRNNEVELLKFLPSGRCVKVKDLHTPGLDTLAEEIFAGKYVPPDVNVTQLFLEYFREL